MMRKVCLEGPGHYLGEDKTLSLMQTEYAYPNLAERISPKEWAEVGKPELIDSARTRKEQILATRAAARFDSVVDDAIRAQFNIYLPR
jgi:trimethylamine--corrinoid protein Co-methyltransferase